MLAICSLVRVLENVRLVLDAARGWKPLRPNHGNDNSAHLWPYSSCQTSVFEGHRYTITAKSKIEIVENVSFFINDNLVDDANPNQLKSRVNHVKCWTNSNKQCNRSQVKIIILPPNSFFEIWEFFGWANLLI